MRMAGIVRVSSLGNRQAGADNMHADRDQIADLQRYATEHGHTLTVLPPELNVSGGLPLAKRPSLLAAIEGVEAGTYDAIIVSYLSRLGRNIREQLKAWDRVEAAGGRIIVVRENIDSATAAGRMHRNILLAIAEHEREQHAERFEQLREWATMAGVWQRRQTPLGYTRDPGTRKLVPDDNAGLVQRAFADRIAGKPISSIARDLNMTPSGTRALLQNRVYLGELQVGQHVNPTAHPPIVSDETWQQAQTARVTRPARVNQHPALLAGLTRCAGCGHTMSRANNKVLVYACHGRSSNGPCPAPAAITLRLLDEHVERIALHQLAQLTATATPDSTKLAEAIEARKAAETELAVFLRDVQAAGLKPGQFAEAALDRADAIEEARSVEDELRARAPMSLDSDPVELWQTLNDSERNHLLGRLIEAVIVYRSGGRGHIRPVTDRVRVLRHGAGVIDTRRYRGAARPIVSVPLLDVDDPRVLGVPASQD